MMYIKLLINTMIIILSLCVGLILNYLFCHCYINNQWCTISSNKIASCSYLFICNKDSKKPQNKQNCNLDEICYLKHVLRFDGNKDGVKKNMYFAFFCRVRCHVLFEMITRTYGIIY